MSAVQGDRTLRVCATFGSIIRTNKLSRQGASGTRVTLEILMRCESMRHSWLLPFTPALLRQKPCANWRLSKAALPRGRGNASSWGTMPYL